MAVTTRIIPMVHPPKMGRSALMRLHEAEAEAALSAFSNPQGIDPNHALIVAMVAQAHATLAAHYAPRRKVRAASASC